MKRKNLPGTTSLPTILGTALTLSTTAFAQSAVLEEVIVTAQKRVESMQDIPISVSALSSSDMEGLALLNASDIAAHVPNLNVSQPYGDGSPPLFALRGVTTTDYSHNQSSPIAIYVDEVYKSSGALQSLQLYDMERIEVLRGPQGTLYGKNATGGAVNFIVKKPNFENEGYLTLGVGNESRQEAKGAFAAQLAEDVLATRAAFIYTKADGSTDNLYPGGDDQGEIDQWALRFGFLYTPSENFDAYLRASRSRSTGENYAVFAGNIQPWMPVNRDHLDFDENEADRGAEKTIENSGVALTINWGIGDAHTLTSISAYDEGNWDSPADDDGLPISVVHTRYESDVDQYTQELRITSDYQGPFNWIGGVFYSEDTVDMDSTLFLWNDPSLGVDLELGGFGFNETNSFTQERTSIAAYAHTTYDLSERITLTLGLRYNDDETKVEDYLAWIGATPIGGTPQLDIPTLGASIGGWPVPDFDFSDTNWSGKAGLDWTPSDNVMLYGTYSQGYRSGAVNAQAFLDPSEINVVDPEEVDAWEVGFKSTLAEGRVRLNGSAFWYDYTDQQFIDVNENALTVLRNTDEATIKGVELEADIQASDTLVLKLGAGYVDGSYDKLELSGIDLSDNDMQSTPEWSFTAGLDWDFLEIAAGTARLHLDTSYMDDVYSDAFNNPLVEIDSYWLANGRLTFDGANKRYTVSAWVRNMFDEEYFVNAIDLNGAGLGYDYFTRGQYRTYGLELTFRM